MLVGVGVTLLKARLKVEDVVEEDIVVVEALETKWYPRFQCSAVADKMEPRELEAGAGAGVPGVLGIKPGRVGRLASNCIGQ